MLTLRNTLALLVLVAAVALLAGCRLAVAQATPPCAALDIAEKTLWANYGEARVSSALTVDGRAAIFLRNAETGTWTMLLVAPPAAGRPAMACAWAAGQNWRPDNRPPPGFEEGS